MSSNAASARHPAACTTCKAEVREACRSLTTNRVTDTHTARLDAAYPTRLPGHRPDEETAK